MQYLPFVRIALRYLSGALLSAGVITPPLAQNLSTNADVALILAGLVGLGISELSYVRARRQGGAT